MSQPAAAALLPIALALAVWSFRMIVRRYRVPRGFPWLPSIVFAAASAAAVFALHALAGP